MYYIFFFVSFIDGQQTLFLILNPCLETGLSYFLLVRNPNHLSVNFRRNTNGHTMVVRRAREDFFNDLHIKQRVAYCRVFSLNQLFILPLCYDAYRGWLEWNGSMILGYGYNLYNVIRSLSEPSALLTHYNITYLYYHTIIIDNAKLTDK